MLNFRKYVFETFVSKINFLEMASSISFMKLNTTGLTQPQGKFRVNIIIKF